MDEFERRLKRDAGKIKAEVTPELESRIRASISGRQPAPRPAPVPVSYRVWLAASLCGAAAAVLLVGVLPRDESPPPPDAHLARTVPGYRQDIQRELTLQVRPAALTAPLEEELELLQADIDKVRQNVEEDLDFTF